MLWRLLLPRSWALAALVVACLLGAHATSAEDESSVESTNSIATEWRVVNAEEVEVAWRIRTIQFFSDNACSKPVLAEPNHTGVPFATNESDMTGAEYAFALRSPRGWESADFCPPYQCHLGFGFYTEGTEVACVLMSQGEEGFHAEAITLQSRHGKSNKWVNVTTWRGVQAGKVKLARACPEVPTVRNGAVSDCKQDEDTSGTCSLSCNEGYGTVETQLRCIHGAWYAPECLALGSIIRLVAHEPELIKPYWVVLDASLYASPDCTNPLRTDGMAVSSGEYVIKYANYHPKNVWDGDPGTSWASSEPCTPGSCYFGLRFRELPGTPVRCVRIEHPRGRQYQATKVSVEALGKAGWEELPDVQVQLLPEENTEL